MIREMKREDVPKCVSIVRENWGEEVAQRFLTEVSHAFSLLYRMEWPPVYFVSVVDDEVVGFAGMMESWIMHKVWDFIWINIDKKHQGQGHGEALTLHRIGEVEKRGGKAIHLMTKNYKFFSKYKFKPARVYTNSQNPYLGNWTLMTLQLGDIEI